VVWFVWVFLCLVAELVFVNESAEFYMSFVSHSYIVNFMLMFTSQEFMIKICVTDSIVLATGSSRDGNSIPCVKIIINSCLIVCNEAAWC
jgi:hypothetical protein